GEAAIGDEGALVLSDGEGTDAVDRRGDCTEGGSLVERFAKEETGGGGWEGAIGAASNDEPLRVQGIDGERRVKTVRHRDDRPAEGQAAVGRFHDLGVAADRHGMVRDVPSSGNEADQAAVAGVYLF